MCLPKAVSIVLETLIKDKVCIPWQVSNAKTVILISIGSPNILYLGSEEGIILEMPFIKYLIPRSVPNIFNKLGDLCEFIVA